MPGRVPSEPRQLTFGFGREPEPAAPTEVAAPEPPRPQAPPASTDTPVGPPAATSVTTPVAVAAAPAPPASRHRLTIRQLGQAIGEVVGQRVKVVITDNRTVMISFKEERGALHLRLHRMFLDAPEAVVGALARYVHRRDSGAGRVLDRYIAAQLEAIPVRKKQRRVRLRTRGAHHDLAALFEELSALFVEPMEDCRITWGQWGKTRGRRRRQRSIQLGTYLQDEKLIRVHPVLDAPDVPRFYVEAVVFHEMLHHAIPPRRQGGRRVVHGPDFRKRERAFRHHADAEAWETKNLTALLARASAGPVRE